MGSNQKQKDSCRLSARQTEILRRKMCVIFADLGLRIKTDVNHEIDVTPDLSTRCINPIRSRATPNFMLIDWITTPCNNQKHTSVNKRLSSITCDEKVFKEAVGSYQKALKDCGYDFEPKYNDVGVKERTDHTNMVLPPFSMNAATNVGKTFLNIIPQFKPLA